MDDAAFQRYFTQPTHACHRQYEALRAVIIDGRSQKDVAEAFGFQYDSFRQLMHRFRRSVVAEQQSTDSPFFDPAGGTALS